MSDKIAALVEGSVGDLNGIYNDPSFSVTDAGETVDLSAINLNHSARNSSHLIIINLGTEDVRVSFGNDGTAITYSDLPGNSWNIQINKNSETPSQVSLDGNIDKIGFRCDSGLSTTLYVVLM
jgi:hypothetical protein